jgi:outer membrane lipoprotein SlyB
MRRIMLLLCVFGLSYFSLAQNKTAWSSLTGLHAGQKIEIVDMQSKKHSGTFVSASDTAISYSETTGEHSIEKQDIRSVKLLEHQRRLRHTLIGAAIGAGVGAAIVAPGLKDGSKGAAAAVGAVIGGISGAAVGALLPTHSTIYKVPAH